LSLVTWDESGGYFNDWQMLPAVPTNKSHHEEVLARTAQMNADVGMLLHRFLETYAS
jgi:hypothetical protein